MHLQMPDAICGVIIIPDMRFSTQLLSANNAVGHCLFFLLTRVHDCRIEGLHVFTVPIMISCTWWTMAEMMCPASGMSYSNSVTDCLLVISC